MSAADEKGPTAQETIVGLENEYIKKDNEVKAAREALTKAQTHLANCEHDAYVSLQQLALLQNRYLMGIIESQQKKIDVPQK